VFIANDFDDATLGNVRLQEEKLQPSDSILQQSLLLKEARSERDTSVSEPIEAIANSLGQNHLILQVVEIERRRRCDLRPVRRVQIGFLL
jgi:hypothetical protein